MAFVVWRAVVSDRTDCCNSQVMGHLMRNFLLFCLALALVLVGEIALSHESLFTVPKNALIERVANMTSGASSDSNAVEVDGIRFEIIVPERVWIIPDNQPDAATKVRIGIRITNQTQTSRRFSRFFTLVPELMGPNGEALELDGGGDSVFPPKESDYPIVMPGHSVTFFLEGRLYWVDNKLQISFNHGFGGVWSFYVLSTGIYQIRLIYSKPSTPAPAYDFVSFYEIKLENVWTGRLVTPFVEVYLVQP